VTQKETVTDRVRSAAPTTEPALTHALLLFLSHGRSVPPLQVAANFTPVPRENFLVGVPLPGRWREVLNSDATLYGGSGVGNLSRTQTVPVAAHGRFQALNLRLPPLGILILEREGGAA